MVEKRVLETERDIQMEIIKTLIEEGAPVIFGRIRKGEDKATRQNVYYHLDKLVKDGYVISELGSDGERSYRLLPAFYDADFMGAIKGMSRTLLYIMKSLNGHATIGSDVKALSKLMEIVQVIGK